MTNTIEIVRGSYSKGNHIYSVGNKLTSPNTPLTYEVTKLYRDTYHHFCERVELVDNNGVKYNMHLHFVNENFEIVEEEAPNTEDTEKEISNALEINYFVIKLNTYGKSYNYYSNHGSFAGKDDVMSYSNKPDAKRFDTKEAAQNYIYYELPEWTRKDKYIFESINQYDLMFA